MGFESENIQAYLEMTGQTFQYVMSGAMQYGPEFIDQLMLQSLKEKKKIVWETKVINGIDLGLLNYKLVSL